ncbi:MAG: 1-acyl-sn-glycerol-3-phosphate acyltransferase [Verrucomicrobia bacterium]|nr:1-acyl-sn-glycerol-3-phosphate acyltransferase [Verrucomicrobiota bacterium]
MSAVAGYDYHPMTKFTDPYFSPNVRPHGFRKLFPTLTFYSQAAWTVWRGAVAARKGDYDDDRWQRDSLSLLRALERTGVRIDIRNQSVFDRLSEPSVIIGNHMSTAETFLLAGVLVPMIKVTFVVKRSLITYPVFGHIMRSRKPVVVGRDNPREDFKTVMEQGTDRLRQGYHVIIFPQRTRSVEFVPEEFNSIGVKLAKSAGAPVVPLALHTEAWGNGKLLKDFGPIRPSIPMKFEFGEPLRISGNGKAENEAVIQFITSRLHQWQPEA